MRLEHGRERQAGFSLIELLTVVAIIILVVAVALPNLREYVRHQRLRGGTEEVITTIQRTRMMAVSKNVAHGVLFVVLSPRTYRYVIEDLQLTGTTGMPGGVYNGMDLTVARATAADLVAVQAGPVQRLPTGIEFAPAGCGITGVVVDTARFGRLGTVCQPGVDANCPAVAAGGYPALAFVGGNVRVCLWDKTRKISRLITVSPGGRTFSQASL